ncbi:MAG: SH3 domain-containing protein [Chloroflexi bacterium]|nr:SH3 domain-containing protein [Chloroflexota bacterium]
MIPTRKIQLVVFAAFTFAAIALTISAPAQSTALAQQPTGSIPTVTGTPSGAIVGVFLDLLQINVYSGPSEFLYPAIGVLLAGQEMPAYGYSEDKTYIQIYYPGVPNSVAWVYAPYVKVVKPGPLPALSSPPTPTPAATLVFDIDPTLVAAFSSPVIPTRLPTFTPPAPLVIATFSEDSSAIGRMPVGLLILGFGFIGALGALISFLRGR